MDEVLLILLAIAWAIGTPILAIVALVRTSRKPRPLYGVAASHGNCVFFSIVPTGESGNISDCAA